jgi:CO/xanthine dehydrogenase Mo-binding subunit
MRLGARAPRNDAAAKTTGIALYPGDCRSDDELHAKVVFSGQPHARMLSMDLSAADAVAGVIAIFTASDVPVNEYGLTLFDQPVMVGLNDTKRTEVASDVSRWEADQIAFVVAESAEAASAAAEAIVVEWEQLPIVADIDAALADNAPLIHPESGSNAYSRLQIRKGDMAEGWAAAAVVVEATYELPYQEHAYLQPEAAVSYVDESDRVTVVVAGQWTVEDQEQIAHALDLPVDRVRVIYPAIGGAFGGREDMTLQIVMALAARHLADAGDVRPIRTSWSREESIVGHHKRHRGRIHAIWGADKNGKITAVESDVILDAGAYNYTSNKVLGNAHLTVSGPYEVPNAHINSRAVYTNAVPGGAFRGFGSPQGAFVAESQMNKLAELLQIDPIEIRRRNVLSEGSEGITQVPMPAGVTMPEVLEACAEAAAFETPLGPPEPFAPIATLPSEPDALRNGRGFGCAYKNVGFSFGFPERCDAKIVLHGSEDDEFPISAELFHGGAEVGQGAHTAFLQMAAEATDLPLDAVRGDFSDTATSGDSGSASASRLTWMAGNSIIGAAQEAEKSWRDGDRPAVGEFRFVPPPTEMLDPETGAGQPNFTYGYVAQAVEVTVDTETGHVRVDRVVSTHDVGRAINPALVEGQIIGGLVQAHGYVISEDLQVENGRILNPRLSGYLMPGIGDLPTIMEPVVLELADPLGPWGARGMAEMPMIPYAPAVIAAVHDATGVWFDSFPLTPSRVLAGLQKADTSSVLPGLLGTSDE